MAYEKHTWTCGEKITDALMNHIEDGIANASSGGILVVTMTTEFWQNCSEDKNGFIYTFSHSWQEIHDSIQNGVPVIIIANGSAQIYITSVEADGGYVLYASPFEFVFDNPTDKEVRICDGIK